MFSWWRPRVGQPGWVNTPVSPVLPLEGAGRSGVRQPESCVQAPCAMHAWLPLFDHGHVSPLLLPARHSVMSSPSPPIVSLCSFVRERGGGCGCTCL